MMKPLYHKHRHRTSAFHLACDFEKATDLWLKVRAKASTPKSLHGLMGSYPLRLLRLGGGNDLFSGKAFYVLVYFFNKSPLKTRKLTLKILDRGVKWV
jgi:hypothetical protein